MLSLNPHRYVVLTGNFGAVLMIGAWSAIYDQGGNSWDIGGIVAQGLTPGSPGHPFVGGW